MSDDRYNNPTPFQPQPSGYAGVDDFDEFEEATALVDLNALQNPTPQQLQGSPPPRQGFNPPPSFSDYSDDDEGGATQMVDLNALQGGAEIATSAPDYSAPAGGFEDVNSSEASTQFVSASSIQTGQQAYESQPPAPSEFATTAHSSVEAAQGTTQFLDINALTQGQGLGDAPSGMPQGEVGSIDQDHTLRGGYQFGPESIQQFGANTLIFAVTPDGLDVVLKRVWDQAPDSFPDWLITRVQQLNQIKHANLAEMNGLFTSTSGCWVELGRPKGVRLTHLLANGPKDPKVVKKWMKQVAAAITAVHTHSVLYGNLNPESIWIEEESSKVTLEPFDVLSFEDRGTLGMFGAPELQMPPDQRPVTPATDTYSFAAVTLMCLTGQVSPQALDSLQKMDKLKDALRDALNPDPTTRPTSFEPILKTLGSAGGFDPRLLVPIVAVLIVLVLGAVLLKKKPKPSTLPQTPVAVAGQEGTPTPDVAALDPLTLKTRVVAPGEVQTDERLKIETSYQLNPGVVVEEDGPHEPTEDEQKMAERERERAQQTLKDAPRADGPMEKQKAYKRVFESLVKIVKLEGALDASDKKMFETLAEDNFAREFYTSYITDVEKPLMQKSIGKARMPYSKLSKLDPYAKSGAFFERHKTPKFNVIVGEGSKKEKK